MNTSDDPCDRRWLRLCAQARTAPEHPTNSAPLGFATRVAALGLAQRKSGGTFAWVRDAEWLCLRGLLAAVTACAVTVVLTYSDLRLDFDPEMTVVAPLFSAL
jgi:cation transporter-like permease